MGSLQNWRYSLKDLWNIAGNADQETGLPYITSHYGFFMVAWHIPLALSGQQADLPRGRLTFDPRVEAPYSLPVLLPGVVGLFSSSQDGTFALEIRVGELQLVRLAVGRCEYKGPTIMEPGRRVQWSCREEDAIAGEDERDQ